MGMLAAWILATTSLAGSPASSSGAAEAELTRLEQVWNDAHLHGNAVALDALWADDLVVAVPKMSLLSRTDALDFARSGRMKFERYETSDLRIRVYGDAAVVTGRLQRARVRDNKKVTDDWLFTKVYVRHDGRWRVVAFHASDAP
jgi:hypothetical protein